LCLDAGNPLSYAGLGPELVTNSNLLVEGDGNFETVTRTTSTTVSISNFGNVIELGKTYQVSWRVLNLRLSNVGAQIRAGSSFMSGAPNLALSPGFYTSTFTNNISTTSMNIYGDNTGGVDFDLDYLSVKELPTSINDLSGNGNNGTLVNGVGYNSGNGGSLSFDGVNDYVSGNLSTLTSWSMCMFYLSTDITSNLVFYPFSCNTASLRSGLGFGGTYRSTTNGRWYFFDGINILSNTNTAVTTNVWYNLVVTKSSTTYNLYTNGSLSYNTSGADINCTSYFLGRRGDGLWSAKGNISQASIYNRVLTPQEIEQNYLATKGRYGL